MTSVTRLQTPGDLGALMHSYHITVHLPSGALWQTSHAKLALLKPQLIFSSNSSVPPFLGHYGNTHHPAHSTSRLGARSALIHLSCFKNCVFSLGNISKTRVLLPADVPTSMTQFHCPVSQTHGCPKCSPTPDQVKEPKSKPNIKQVV